MNIVLGEFHQFSNYQTDMNTEISLWSEKKYWPKSWTCVNNFGLCEYISMALKTTLTFSRIMHLCLNLWVVMIWLVLIFLARLMVPI